MAQFSYDGFSIAYEQRGRRGGAGRRPILLMHGLLFSRTHHHYLANVLAERGNRVILMDLLGHGQSDKPTHSRHYTMELFARQALALLDDLDITDVVVGGPRWAPTWPWRSCITRLAGREASSWRCPC
ncbi:MAG: alpha/beta hydrolase [Actinomycetota bacterium]|nr:alpha/beta hydrolase [Actinomycetota bacterium]